MFDQDVHSSSRDEDREIRQQYMPTEAESPRPDDDTWRFRIVCWSPGLDLVNAFGSEQDDAHRELFPSRSSSHRERRSSSLFSWSVSTILITGFAMLGKIAGESRFI
jgi:hypothetical protein